jgi:hypothetical protein
MSPNEMAHALRLLKVAQGKPGILKKIWSAAREGSEAAAKKLEGEGHDIAGGLVRYMPHLGLGAGGIAAWKSDPAERMKYKYKLWKYRRAQRQAQRGY